MSAVSPLEKASFRPNLDTRRRMLASIGVVAGGVLSSRVLGLLRDMATASLLGLSSSVLDALVVAFRIPNLFRALFGEGALATCYMPLLAERRRESEAAAWRLASAVCFWLTLFLCLLVLVGEAICGICRLLADEPRTRLLLQLLATLLPYLVPVCLAAQVAATLQTCSRFTAAAAAPMALNVVWLIAAWFVAPALSEDPAVQAHVLALAILLAGVLQLAMLLPALRQLKFRFQLTRAASREAFSALLPALCPAMLALAVTRINTFCDSLVAWLMAERGAAGAIYCAERLAHFPIGLVGVSIATVVFPQLNRAVASRDPRALGAELGFGLRLSLLLGIPASAGLWLLAEPLAWLLFGRGQFTAADAARTAALVRCYSLGVWACCALPVVLRAYYALGDRSTPLRVGCGSVMLNLLMNLSLVGVLGESALALSTSLCAVLQCLLLVGVLAVRIEAFAWREPLFTTFRSLAWTAPMLALGRAVLGSGQPAPGFSQTMTTVAACLLFYVALAWRFERSWLPSRLS